MTKPNTFETLMATEEALAVIRSNAALQVCALHIRCDKEPTFIGVRVNEPVELLAWCDHLGNSEPITVYQASKGTNLFYRPQLDGKEWHVWLLARAVTAEELLPGVEIDGDQLDNNGSLVGRIGVEDLRKVVNR